jgi:short-subunit dehydrogenase
VVMAALPDDLLEQSHKELSAKYPNIQFRKVAVRLGDDKYLQEIIKNTEDIPVTIIFNNAGYIQYAVRVWEENA